MAFIWPICGINGSVSVQQANNQHILKIISKVTLIFRKMAPKLCFRNKYGHCKLGGTCPLTHINTICEIKDCEVASCENRHPTECFWYKEFKWCRFKPCSYRHTSVHQPEKEKEIIQINSDLEYKLKQRDNSIDELITKMTHLEIKIVSLETKQNTFNCEHCDYLGKSEKKLRQHTKKNHIELDLNKTLEDDYCDETRTLLSDKIEKLEKFVLTLHDKYRREIGWEDDVTLEALIRRNSHEITCDDCEYKAQNKSRLTRHMTNKHEHKCDICGEFYVGQTVLDEHMECVHNNSETPMTDSEMEMLDINGSHMRDILKGPDTPRKEALKKYNLRFK